MSLLAAVSLIAIVACFAGVFVLSLSEASLLAVNRHDMETASRRGDRRARQVLEITSAGDFLSVFIVGVNTLVLIISNRMTFLVHEYYGMNAHTAETIAHIAMLSAILVIGELWPKTYGSLRAEPSAKAVSGIMTWLIRVLNPMVRLMTWISNAMMRAGGASPVHHSHFVTAEEIQAAADLGEEEGTVQPDEGEMLDSVMALGERTVKDIMVPRVNVVAMPEDATLEELLEVAVDSGYSRVPVYKDSIDHVTGIVYVNDTLASLSRGERDLTLGEVARTPILAPESKPLDEMLWELRQQKVHIAIVIDEFGGTEGLVTIEDILEELVGEIEDEHDLPEPEVLVTSDGEAIVQGKARIDDLNEQLGLAISTEDHDTVSGFLTGMAGRVPEEGEVMTVDGATFVVVESNDQHVDRLRVIAPTGREAEL